jgi:hypothetical protein
MKKINVWLATLLLSSVCTASFAINHNHDMDDADLSVGLTRVSVYMETDIQKAFRLIDELKVKYPDNPKLLAAEADAYAHIEDPEHARLLLKRAHQLDPEDDDIAEEYRKIDLYKPFAAMDAEFKRTSGQNGGDERIGHILGEGRISDKLALGTVLEDDYVTTKPLLLSSGQTRSFNEYRQQGQVYARYELDNGDTVKASVYGSNHTLGGGAQYQMLEAKGWTVLEANVRKPEWDDFVVNVVDQGVKDDVKLSQLYRITPQIPLNLAAAVNRYGLRDDSDLVDTYQFLGELSYEFEPGSVHKLLGSASTIAAHYAIDAEYLFHDDREVRDFATGGNYAQPLAFPSHNVHSVTLSASKEWSAGVWRLEGSGGFAEDLLGGSGPLLEAAFMYKPNDAFDAALKAQRSILSEETSEKVDMIGFELRWKFL